MFIWNTVIRIWHPLWLLPKFEKIHKTQSREWSIITHSRCFTKLLYSLIVPIITASYIPRKLDLDNNVFTMGSQAFFSAPEVNFHQSVL
jgi:hypothetical protein